MIFRPETAPSGRCVWTPKPYKIPNDFAIVVDTREQKPMCIGVPGLTVVRRALRDGDYSIKGFEQAFVVERKMYGDFYSYIGSERKKTKAKLERLSQYRFAALVVESTFDDLMLPGMFSSISPETARQFLVSVNIRYGIHIYMDRSRGNIERWIIDRAVKFYTIMRTA